MSEKLYSFSVTTSNQQTINLADYQGKVLLIVNTASKCGFTPQYEKLQQLQDKYGADKFVVLAFPCNQFGHQEPENNTEINKFCQLNYQVSFPVFAKIEVNGRNAEPLFTYLKSQQRGLLGISPIKWNFTKFLIDKNGAVVQRYAPITSPSKLTSDIDNYLAS
ncbi:MAG: glutathione peroxidase [Methylococcales bacterium]|nr:glutathione peroxidase [Methylococcales bacterium]